MGKVFGGAGMGEIGGQGRYVHLAVEHAPCIPEPGAGEMLGMYPANQEGLFGRDVDGREDELASPNDDDQSPSWSPTEIPLGDGRTLVLGPT